MWTNHVRMFHDLDTHSQCYSLFLRNLGDSDTCYWHNDQHSDTRSDKQWTPRSNCRSVINQRSLLSHYKILTRLWESTFFTTLKCTKKWYRKAPLCWLHFWLNLRGVRRIWKGYLIHRPRLQWKCMEHFGTTN